MTGDFFLCGVFDVFRYFIVKTIVFKKTIVKKL